MNCIERKREWRFEWTGTGIVRIKERSLLQSVWRFCKWCERQLQLVTKGSDIQRASQAEKQNARFIPESQFLAITQPTLQQAQTAAHKPETIEMKTPKARSMGVLTEIRRYTAAENDAAAENADARESDEQDGLQQLLPALSGYCSDRWLVLVSAPQRPDVKALTASGIDPSRVLLVHARGDNGLKIVEQALQSGTCGAVVAWLEACDSSALQRLRHAAVAGQAWGVMFREGERDLAMPSKQKTIAPLANETRRNAIEESGAQIVDIYSGIPRPSAYLSKQLTKQTQETETTQLEMAIN